MIRKTIILMLTLGAVGTGALWVMSYLHWPGLWTFDGTAGGYSYRLGHTVEWGAREWFFSVWGASYWRLSRGGVEIELPGQERILGATLPPDLPSNRYMRLAGFEFRRQRSFSRLLSHGNEVDQRSLPPGVSIDYKLRLPVVAPFIVLAAYPTVAFIRGLVCRWRRRRKGLCLTCGYNLTGNVSGVCPECGTEIKTP